MEQWDDKFHEGIIVDNTVYVVPEAEVLSAKDFLEKMKTEHKYHIVQSGNPSAVLEMYVLETDGNVSHYLSPDFLDMPGHEVAAFFEEFNAIMRVGEPFRNIAEWKP